MLTLARRRASGVVAVTRVAATAALHPRPALPSSSLSAGAATAAVAAAAALPPPPQPAQAHARSLHTSAPLQRGGASASDSSPSSPSTFAELQLSAPLVSALQGLGVRTPTPIQAHAMPTLLQGKNALLASHTGSGKTLTYLLPIIQQLKRDEELYRLPTRLCRPRALVVVPNRELAVQVLSVAKSLSHEAKFRSFASTGFIPLHKLSRALESPIDLLVVTPGRLEFLLRSHRISLGDVRYVVLDETDTLLSPEHGFVDMIQRNLLTPIKSMVKERVERQKALEEYSATIEGDDTKPPTTPSNQVQFIFCSASITPPLEEYLTTHFPNLQRLHSSSLHHLPRTLVMNNVLVGNQDKKDVLWSLLQRESENYKRRLMHNRTREQNQAELAALGGDEQAFWQRLTMKDSGVRGGNHAPTLPSPEAIGNMVQAQVEFDESVQSEEEKERREKNARNMKKKLEQLQKERQQNGEDDNEMEDAEEHEDDTSDPDHPSHSSSLYNDTPSSAPSRSSSSSLVLPLPPTLIFCNTVSCCRAIAWFLTEQGLNVGHYHGLMPAQYRTLHFRNFLAGVTNVLVCTDLASRGLDTTFVQHVIHFDFPFSVLDFIHRVGRTARNGAKGKSTGLLEKKDRVLASAIERLSARGLSIEQLSADRSRYGPDGLPLSSSTDPARYHASYQAPARLQPSTYTNDGKKVLAPTRRPAANNGLKPGEEPRRRWMRYMAPKDRNQHKLLYSKFAHKDAQGENHAEGDRSEAAHPGSSRKQGGLHPSRPGTIKKKHTSSSSSADHDPFAFSSPYGRNRNATHVQPKGTVPATRFPQAPGTLKRTQAARPVGPLAHKQRVGAIFASGNNQSQAAKKK